jgi:5-enolpyruvylshikimate-3-phosphate synthase
MMPKSPATPVASPLLARGNKGGSVAVSGPDGLIIRPPDRLTPAAIDTYDDHRMAMSFALAGLK